MATLEPEQPQRNVVMSADGTVEFYGPSIEGPDEFYFSFKYHPHEDPTRNFHVSEWLRGCRERTLEMYLEEFAVTRRRDYPTTLPE